MLVCTGGCTAVRSIVIEMENCKGVGACAGSVSFAKLIWFLVAGIRNGII